MMFSDVIDGVMHHFSSIVSVQSCVQIHTILSNIGGSIVGEIDLVNFLLVVDEFVLVFDVV